MTALLVIDTVVTVLVGVLLVGVLRGYAEVLRRLEGTESTDQRPRKALPARDRDTDEAEQAVDVSGVTPAGNSVQLSMQPTSPDTLLLFLSSGCLVCRDFFKALKNPKEALPTGLRAVIVTKGPQNESPAKVAELDPKSVPLVMSDETWEAYEVPGSPFFTLIDGALGLVVGEGSAPSWQQLASLLSDALADSDLLGRGDAGAAARARRQSNVERQKSLDEALAAAGIEPDDPTLQEPTVEGEQTLGPEPART
jgi:hypothetical protein